MAASTDDERDRAVEILEKLLTKLNERVDLNIESHSATKGFGFELETELFAEMRGDLAEAISLLSRKTPPRK